MKLIKTMELLFELRDSSVVGMYYHK